MKWVLSELGVSGERGVGGGGGGGTGSYVSSHCIEGYIDTFGPKPNRTPRDGSVSKP